MMENNFTEPDLVMVFKTNLTDEKDVRQISALLNLANGIIKWTIDLSDIDRVLRIEAFEIKPFKIMQLVATAGYSCEELTD